MKLPLDEVKAKFREALATSGADPKDVETYATIKLEQDLHGNFFSCLDEVEGGIRHLKASIGKKQIIEVDKPGLKLINGNGRAAILISYDIMPMVCDMARTQGIAMVGIYNSTYHEALEMYSRDIAAQDLICIMSANGGPQGVVPFGGRKDIMGTNPLTYGIPTNDLPIVFDGATAKHAYGSIREAKRRNNTLPEQEYLDKDGNWTTDPNLATALIAFGEYKGYAINLMLEVMTGCMVRAKSGLDQHTENELGSFFIVIDPSAFGPIEDFKAQTTKLAKDIEAIKPADGFSEVRVPGYKGERRKQETERTGLLEVEDAVWERFEAQYKALTK